MRKLVSKLAHLVVSTPCLEDSVKVYHDVLGLEISGRVGGSVYLRGWGEHFRHSLELREGDQAGVEVIGWRAQGQEELEIAVERVEATGRAIGWVDPAFGRGKAFRYRGPAGHLNELFWDVERFKAADHAPFFPNRAQKYMPRGAAVREIDHVTINSTDIQRDVDWYGETLGHKFMEYIVAEEPPHRLVFAMTTTGERGHDMAFVPEMPGNEGRVNHIAFWCDQRVELHRAADVLLDAGIPIEFGPGRHGLGEQEYLYFREPSGLRVELNGGGYRIADPDWQPVRWVPSQGANVWYRNLAMPHSMFDSFPAEPRQTNVEEAFGGTKMFV